MGICGSSPSDDQLQSKQQSKKVEQDIRSSRNKAEAEIKLLLLGAGESGKSTFFKQIKFLHVASFTPEEGRGYIPLIHNNVLLCIKALLANVERFGEGQQLQPSNEPAANRIGRELQQGLNVDSEVTPDIAAQIAALWKDPAVQTTYSHRNRFQLYDSAAFYLDKVEEVARPDYAPSSDDLLRCRVRTSGIVEFAFQVENVSFRLVDVGGQRNERKKWIHCFEGVQAVIFFAALSGYDLTLYEDETVNRMVEALDLFEEVANSRWFVRSSMILFLNKKDLFQEKIQHSDLSLLFPEYTGGCNYEPALNFIRDKFLERNRTNRPVYVHVTCATDASNVSLVFQSCKDTILRQNLHDSGLTF